VIRVDQRAKRGFVSVAKCCDQPSFILHLGRERALRHEWGTRHERCNGIDGLIYARKREDCEFCE
jgi:hypothetical protein